jgi:hypothetical protein
MTNRDADVTKIDGTILVRCYENDVLIRTIDVTDHSLRYADDTIENWINGIIKNDSDSR